MSDRDNLNTPGEPRKNNAEEDVDTKLQYGLCPNKTSSLQQVCNNPKAFTAWLCLYAFVQGFIVNGIINVNVSTLERRYNLASWQASLIASSYDISAGLFVLPVTYWGTHAHQPRWLAFSALIMSVGSFISVIPQFTSGQYELGAAALGKCVLRGNSTECGADTNQGLSNYLYVFMFGQFLHGIGGTVLYSLGIVFIDSHVKDNESPLYQGVFYAAATVGPALGFILGGQILNIYVDIGSVDMNSIDITPDDPRFVGAWWIGYIISGCLLLPVVFGLLPYPKYLPEKEAIDAQKVSQAHQNGSEEIANREGFGKSIKDFPIALKIMFKNPVNVLLIFAAVSESILTSGFSTFMPKFIQSQYGLSAGISATIGGGLAVAGAAGGQFIGGVICKVKKLKVRGMLIMTIILCGISTILALGVLAYCPTDTIAGVTVTYLNGNQIEGVVDINNMCNSKCGCSSGSYEPICAKNGIQYFSACHGGCLSDTTGAEDIKIYSNCSCIPPTLKSTTDWKYGQSAVARGGKCSSTCNLMFVFLPIFFLLILTTFMVAIPSVTMTMRCIPDSQRAFGLGVKWVFVRFLGSVPGPIIFGAIFDSACLQWQNKCDGLGSCWIYDNYALSWRILAIALCLRAFTFFMYVAAFFVYKPPPENTDKVILTDKEATSSSSTLKVVAMDTISERAKHAHSNPNFKNDE